MAKRASDPPQKTELVINKSEFTSEVQEFMRVGTSISERQIDTRDELDSLEQEFSDWRHIAREFLKQAFNNPQNEYLEEFKNAGSLIGVEDVFRGANIHHPQYKLEKFYERIQSKLNYLNNLLAKLKYIPSQVESSSTFQADDLFTKSERQEMNEKIDQVFARLGELRVGQEIVFDELEELRSLLNMSKKNWKQVLKGKLLDLGLGKFLDKETLEWIYKKLTDEDINLLNQ